MKNIRPYLLSAALAAILAGTGVQRAAAEDIDLFVAQKEGGSGAGNPNILIVVDNSANWAANNQNWPGRKQGEAELNAISTLLDAIPDSSVNLGLMLFTDGSGSNMSGGYVRFHVQNMDATNKKAFKDLLGAATGAGCVDGANSLNGTPNCIYKNFASGSLNESTGTAKLDYGAAMFEVFKYFGGWSSPAKANDASPNGGSPQDTTEGFTATHFGNVRFAGNPDLRTDPLAFGLTKGTSTTARKTYVSPIDANSCAANYVIFIGNGFPPADQLAKNNTTPVTPPDTLKNVGADTTQLSMPTYSIISKNSTVTLASPDTTCYVGNNKTQATSACNSASATNYPDYFGFSLSARSCSSTTATACTTGGSNGFKNMVVTGTLGQPAVLATGSFATPSANNTRYADEWAKFLYTTDVHKSDGRQYVQTYAIDVFRDAPSGDQSSLLSSMAKFGGGKYFQATTDAAIVDALRRILVEIQSVNQVFASASLPINATNRSQNENQVFIGMFQPDKLPRWYGNLKRYQIGLFGQEAKLADKDGLDAVDTSTTGFINACATSFWTTDSGDYWKFVNKASNCTTTTAFSKLSDIPDGPAVQKGGAAEVVRLGNNPPQAATTGTGINAIDYKVNRTIYTCSTASGSASGVCKTEPTAMDILSTSTVSQTLLGVTLATDQSLIVRHAIGYDVNNENGVSVSGDGTLDVRASVHGDVAHSRPLPVNYGGTNGVVLYYGSNDGAFRAVRGSDGKELWSFVAPEHHSKLTRLYKNDPIIDYPGVSSASAVPKDYFFDGSAGIYQTFDSSNNTTAAWVFPSMRRGGRLLYAFNVTDPTKPTLKWRVGCPFDGDDTGCTLGYEAMGQTWSLPNIAVVKGYGSGAKPLIVMGGGYDTCEDKDVSTPDCSVTKGNRVYVIDAGTGTLIAEFKTERAVAGDATLVDRNFDSLVDHAYVADTGGSIYRVDFVDPASLVERTDPKTWTMVKIAQTNLSDKAGRKFLFGPAALPTSKKVYLTLTSGDRERPLDINYPYQEKIQNRAYMLVDQFTITNPSDPTQTPIDLDDEKMMNNFTSDTKCGTTLSSGSNGWFFNLTNGQGEQGVTASIIFGGLVFFSTNFPDTSKSATSCKNDLGKAAGYAVNLLNASGAVGSADVLCEGGSRSNLFTGGGLPPSPVTGSVPINGRQVTVMIGGIDRSGAASSPIGSQSVRPTISQRRARIYWYKKGDQ